MKTLNFNQGCIVGTSELIEYNQELREEFKALLQEMGNSSSGILLNRNKDAGKVSVGNSQVGGYNTISIVSNCFCVGSPSNGAYVDPVISEITFNGLPFLRDVMDDLFIYSQPSILNRSIPGIGSIPNGSIKYVVSVPRRTVFEEGTCNISATAQVVFTDVRIVKKLRSQITNSPSKITFFTDSSTKFRSGEIFEVMSIVNDTTIIISGDFTAAVSNLYCAIIGSYDIQELPNLVDKYLYTYYRGDVQILNNIEDTYGGVVLAKLTFNEDQSFSIQDLREVNRYSFSASTSWVDITDSLATTPNYSTYIDTTKSNKVEVRISSTDKIEVRGSLWLKGLSPKSVLRLSTNGAVNRVVSSSKCASGLNIMSKKSDITTNFDTYLDPFLILIPQGPTTKNTVEFHNNYIKAGNNLGASTDTDAFVLIIMIGIDTLDTTEPYIFGFDMNSVNL